MPESSPESSSEESLGTVLIALGVNLAVAVAKFVAGLIGHSASLMSEGAHSVADTFNEVMLFTAIKRSHKRADQRHPFGYGKERFFYALLAAVGIFVAGAGFSVIQGVQALLHPTTGPQSATALIVTYGVLAVSAVLEGVSWVRSVRQLRGEARPEGRSVVRQWQQTIDPTVKTVAVEDSAALIGVVLAFGGVAAHQATGSSMPEGVASLAIGALLVVVAVVMIRTNKDLLIGQAAQPGLRRAIVESLESRSEVTSVVELLTEILGPGELLVAARVDIADDLSGAQVEDISTELEQELHARFPSVTQVFLDATRRQTKARRVEA